MKDETLNFIESLESSIGNHFKPIYNESDSSLFTLMLMVIIKFLTRIYFPMGMG